MKILYWAFFIVSIFLTNKCQLVLSTEVPKLLVVSLDGFRADYFERDVIPFMKDLKTKGMYADHIYTAFPPKTLTSHHTMATGMYAESHGAVDTGFYDVKTGKKHKTSYELFHYNNEIIPVYTLNEKAGHGRRSGAMMWPGGEYEYDGVQATFGLVQVKNYPSVDRINQIISWFNHSETPINLGMVYFQEPDRPGHYLGYKSERFNKVLEKVDNDMRYLNEKLKEIGLSNMNVIYVGDHGMASATLKKVNNLTKYIDPADYEAFKKHLHWHIFPHPGKEEKVYNALKKGANETNGYDVWWKQDIPKRFHYTNNPRIGPILALCKPGYSFPLLYKMVPTAENEFHVKVDENHEFGIHGYDNLHPDMYTAFFAVGPAFVPNCKVEPFNNVDLFSLFCELLEIPIPHSNGTLDTFKHCLRKYQT